MADFKPENIDVRSNKVSSYCGYFLKSYFGVCIFVVFIELSDIETDDA